MKHSWKSLSERSNGVYEVPDFERAAYRLVTEQVLYAHDRASRVAYRIVEDHFEDYVAVLAPLGIRLQRNAHHRYVVALPAHGEGTPVTLAETLLLLVLRQRYDVAMREGQIEDHGEVIVELPELQEAYQSLVERAMPEVGVLRALARTLRRWGVCQVVDTEPGDPQPFHFRVRPALVDIVGEQWLQRLDQHNRSDDSDDAETDVTEDDDAAA